MLDMLRYRYLARRVACLTAALAAFSAHQFGVIGAEAVAAEGQQALIAVLESPDSPPADKAITCKHLARLGGKEAVPALASLLTDEQLAAWARIALEAIPDPAAGEALREAASRLQGRLLIGVVNSIGMRGDAKAVELLSQKLNEADADVAAAAAVALGRIGDGAATRALEQFLTGPSLAAAPKKVRSAVAEGCILCAERSDQAGDAGAAVKLFEAVRRAEMPKQRILEATRGVILARKAGGIAELLELLRSDDRSEFALGLWVARELPGTEATGALVAELEKMPAERQALVMLALMDRADRPPLGILVQAAEDGPKTVRIAAIQAMRRQGDVSCVPVLLGAAAEADADVATAAAEALEELPGAEVNADLAARLAKAEGPTRLTLIELAGRRGIKAAVPELVKAADDPDGAIRAAAFASLGDTVDFSLVPWLIERTVQAKSPEELAAAGDALRAAADRMPDPDACAKALAAAMPGAGTPAKCKLLEALGAVGGARALAAVVEATKSPEPAVQGAAAQQLGDWMTPAAAPALLDMAKNAADDRLKVRALRGYLRIARQFVVPDAERLAMFHAAMDAARRDDERQLALGVLIRIPSPETLAEAMKYLSQPSLRDAAADAAVAIAGKLEAGHSKAVAEAMQKVLDSGVGDPLKTRAQQLRDQAKAAQ
ncbi:MAG: HEAT repeat domain-containing protein [Thermoguttaceae bacterium]|jgi:HEAT repeat protein|nr:HEAT repeat domain-containing protein [Thermoguttaceae bacterium]